MSHEIRTPLNAIIGFTEMLRADTLDPELREEYFDIINQSSQALLKLIDDIIDVAKIEAGHIRIIPHKVDITALLQELHVIIRRDVSVSDKEVDVILNVPWDGEFMINVDSFRLKQVFLNILNNAVKFTERGEIEFGYRLKGNTAIEFFVRDTGIGIPADQHKVIFDRFRQADGSSTRKYGGTGLGLWVSRNLVELMGGTIRVVSEPGRGATFFVELPLGKDVDIPDSSGEVTEERQTITDWRDKKILIAEDNDSNYEYLKAVLSVKKAVLVRAYDGKEALDLLRDHQDVDLVLMDIQMPVLNGYEATKLIKKFKPEVPVIAQTAYAMSEDRERIINAGCDEYIAKPIQPRKLLALIEKFLIDNNAG
jgi:CheY-like chemotaxis protein